MHNPAQDDDYEQRIQSIQANINKYQNQLRNAEKTKKTTENTDRVKQQLSDEYIALRQARLDRKQQFKDLHDSLPALRRERQKDIQTRQKQFEDDLTSKQAKTNSQQVLIETCEALEQHLMLILAVDRPVLETEGLGVNEQQPRSLQAQESDSTQEQQQYQQQPDIQVVNESIQTDGDADIDTSVLLIPLEIMEQFWAVGVEAPVKLNEVELTLAKIRERKEEITSQ